MSETQGNTEAPSSPKRRISDCLWGETARDKRNLKRFAATMFVWAIVFTGADWVQENRDVSDGLAWALAVLPLLPAIAVFAAFIKFLRETDEMVRRVHMNGLAVGFGAGAFVVMGIQPPAIADGTSFDKELVFAAMAVGMAAGTLWSARRYR